MTRASHLFLMAVSDLLFAAAAEAQGVSFIAPRDFGVGPSCLRGRGRLQWRWGIRPGGSQL